jgi:hypothetical protein
LEHLDKVRICVIENIGIRHSSLSSYVIHSVLDNLDDTEKMMRVKRALKDPIGDIEKFRLLYTEKTGDHSLEFWNFLIECLVELSTASRNEFMSYVMNDENKISIRNFLTGTRVNVVNAVLDKIAPTDIQELRGFLIKLMQMKFNGNGIVNVGKGELFCALLLRDAKKSSVGDIEVEGFRIEVKGISAMYGDVTTGLLDRIDSTFDTYLREIDDENLLQFLSIERANESLWFPSTKGLQASSRVLAHLDSMGHSALVKKIVECYFLTYAPGHFPTLDDYSTAEQAWKSLSISVFEAFREMLIEYMKKQQCWIMCVDISGAKNPLSWYNQGEAVFFSEEMVKEIVCSPYTEKEGDVRILPASPGSQTGRPMVTITRVSPSKKNVTFNPKK